MARAVPPPTKRDLIFEELRRQILSGELERGARMPQDDLAQQFNASITPVREALRLLEAEGLLISEPHRGARVAAVDMEKVKALYVVRRLVESYAMQRATSRCSPHALDQVRGTLELADDARRRGDLRAVRAANRDFHFFFYDRCGLSGLSDRIEVLWQGFPWDLMLGTPERAEQSHREHLAILKAVEQRDAQAAAEATEAHIAGGFAALARRLTEDEEPLRDPFALDVD